MHIIGYIKNIHFDHIYNIKTDFIKCGFYNFIGNKVNIKF